ncbi:hypothetical protein BSLG_008889 [Batrachochytrium salamandrivorans]|nr:hypothetical protein BSLG_008889 [Batrachochytrium salamandrivorans]
MKNEKARVVGVLVQPTSGTKDVQDAGCDFSASSNKYILQEGQDNAIQYTYSTFWVVDPISWGTRWDHYLHVFDPQIHWFSIINSIVIVLILGSMVTMILLRTLHKDIARYNSIGDEDGAQEEFGWKMVHADVFRPPMFRMLLSVLVGNGAQLLYMGSVTLGALGTMALVFYVLFSTVSGYISAVLTKLFKESTGVKIIIFGVLLILNFFLIARNSSSAVPFGTLLALPVYLNKYYSALIGGVLPFGAIFIELYFIMSSIWSHRIYYMFGFLLFVFVILIMTCSLVSVLLCYFQLCAEDYMWSWRSFMTSGASGFYIMLYSIVYAARRLHLVDFSSLALYFTWSLVISLMFTVFTGTVGYVSAFAFIRVIYSAIKVD